MTDPPKGPKTVTTGTVTRAAWLVLFAAIILTVAYVMP